MKRSMAGGALRGPVAPMRQRRTIRFVQVLLALMALSLAAFAVLAFIDRTAGQAAVLVVLSIVSGSAAWLLSDGPSVRVPTPARLDELAGRAEAVAIEKAAD
jgi:hypothetical protein